MDKPVIEDRVIEQWVHDLVPPARLMSVGASDPGRIAAMAAESGGALHVAMDNCPNQVVLCGSPEAIEAARTSLEGEGALCQFLPFDRGYHTPMYRPICARLEQSAGTYEDRIPRIPVYCTTTGKRLPDEPAAIRRIMIDQWAEPIRFRETIEAMYADGVRVFLEVGPRGNLTGFTDDILAGRDYAAIPCNLASRGGLLQLHHALALLCAHGVPVNLACLYARRNPTRLALADGDAPTLVPPSRRRPLKLKMDIPIITLDEKDRATLRDCLETALVSPGLKPTRPHSSPTQLLGCENIPSADDLFLHSHITTLDTILATHEEIMHALIDRASDPTMTESHLR